MHAIGHLFTVLIIQPIFNLLVLIYALLPGHSFGLAVILFTIIVRLLLWPLVKKQLHSARAMRELAPEIKKIKVAAKGDRQKESRLTMELYKEKGVNPLATLGVTLLQLPVFIALYLGIRKIVFDPQQVINFSYPVLHHLSWLKTLAQNIHQLDFSFLGIDLSRKPLEAGGLYSPALIIAALAAAAQYFQSKQLMPKSKDSRSLRSILGSASQGKQADPQEVNAAVGRSTIVLIPLMVFIFGLSFPAALPLYWLVNSSVAYLQQTRVLNQDEQELETQTTPDKVIVEPASPTKIKKSAKNKHRHTSKHKRKKR